MEELMMKLEEILPLALPVAGGAIAFILVLIWTLQKFLIVCAPNRVLILSGRKRVGSDGREVGFRVVKGGRAFRVPVIETAEWLDMTNISVPMSITGAYSEGNIPLTVQAVANVKVANDDTYLGNAIERFLGRGRGEIARVAKETLEGHLRGVLAKMTPEEVNEDRLKFAKSLTDEAEEDLNKLGLHLDTLKIQHVSDDIEYLDSIGRKRVAEVLRAAEVAESDAVRAAKEAEAASMARSQVARTNAEAVIMQRENELRQIRADLDAEAKSEEERALAAALTARAQAEKELQSIRGRLEELRLAADVTIPAEVERRVRELWAAGEAASIAEDGRAMAEALEHVATAWRETEGQAMDIFVLQNLEEIFSRVTNAAKNLKVREVNLIDSGDGATMPAYLASYPAAVASLLTQIERSLGIDITSIISGDKARGDAVAKPPAPRPAAPAGAHEGGQAW
jgi:flotillin